MLRADVGITEQAWEVREEELDRVRSLQSERARQEQLLDEELKEVRDDGVEPGQPSQVTAGATEERWRGELRAGRGWPGAIGGALCVLSRACHAPASPRSPRGHGAGARQAARRGGGRRLTARRVDDGAQARRARRRRRRRRLATPARTDGLAAPTASTVPTLKPHAPPLPPPTPEQLAALEAHAARRPTPTQKGARDYKDTITTIITLHYEEKKKSILGGLDREIEHREGRAQEGARDAPSSGSRTSSPSTAAPNAQPEETPDAMYRLAALYEERARSDDDPNVDLAITLKPAIALYKRVIREFPKYRELAGIYYFLGHALNDSRRIDEAQQVWRSLVCHNHYPYPSATDPKDPDVDTIVADAAGPRPAAYWNDVAQQVPDARVAQEGAEGRRRPSTIPYPQRLRADPAADTAAGRGARSTSPRSGGTSATGSSTSSTSRGGVVEYEPVRGVGLQSRGERLHALDAVQEAAASTASRSTSTPGRSSSSSATRPRYASSCSLLNYTDEQREADGRPRRRLPAARRTRTSRARSTNFDFAGPAPSEPYIARPDILDTAKSPAEAEHKLHIAIDRVQDPRLIPQDKPWTIEIYKALALEFRTINQYKNALDRLPDDARQVADGSVGAGDAERDRRGVRPARARRRRSATSVTSTSARCSRRARRSPSTSATRRGSTRTRTTRRRSRRAEELVRTGLKGAAVTHTRNGQAARRPGRADERSEGADPLTNYALSEYKLAALGWLGYLKQDENAPDAYKSRYFYADALHNQVRLEVVLHKFDAKQYPEPTSQEIATAMQAAVDVRDSDEDDEFIDNAGLFVVDLADVDRDLAFQRFEDTGGTQGVEQRKEPKLEGPDGRQEGRRRATSRS